MTEAGVVNDDVARAAVPQLVEVPYVVRRRGVDEVGEYRFFGFQGGVSWSRSDQLGLPA